MVAALLRLISLLFGTGIIFVSMVQVAGHIWDNPIVAVAAEQDAYQYDTQTHVLHPLAAKQPLGETRIAFSSDAQYLAINDRNTTRSLVVMNLHDGTRVKLHDFVGDFQWSRSGNLIAFTGLSPAGRDILIAAPDGTERHNLTQQSINHLLLGWSAEDDAVIYMSRIDEQWHITQTSTTTGQAQPLFSLDTLINQFAASPDGRYLAYTTQDGSDHYFVIRGIDGTIADRIPVALAGSLVWSSDSGSIAITQYHPATGLTRDLLVYNRQTQRVVQRYLFPNHTIQAILWGQSPDTMLIVGAHHLNATTRLFGVHTASPDIHVLPFSMEIRPNALTWHP